MGSSSSSQTSSLMFPVGNILQEALLPKDKGSHRGWNCFMSCMFKSIFIFPHTWLRAELSRVNIIFPQNSEGTVIFYANAAFEKSNNILLNLWYITCLCTLRPFFFLYCVIILQSYTWCESFCHSLCWALSVYSVNLKCVSLGDGKSPYEA